MMVRRAKTSKPKSKKLGQATQCDAYACDDDDDCAAVNCGTCERVGPRVPGKKVCS